MEMKDASKMILGDILGMKKSFKSTYEQKCFIIGLTNIMVIPEAPDNIKNPATISRLIQEVLSMLDSVQKREQKEAAKKARKQIHNDDDESSEDEETSSEDDYDDEEVEIKKLDNGKRSRSNSRGAGDGDGEEMMDDENMNDMNDGEEETKTNGRNEFGLGLTNDDAKSDDLSEDEDYDNAVSAFLFLILIPYLSLV